MPGLLRGVARTAVIAGTAFIAAVALTIGNVVWFSTLQRHIPEHAISRISSFDWLGSVVFNPLGYALIGPLAVAFGTEEMLIVAGVQLIAVYLILAVAFYFVPAGSAGSH